MELCHRLCLDCTCRGRRRTLAPRGARPPAGDGADDLSDRPLAGVPRCRQGPDQPRLRCRRLCGADRLCRSFGVVHHLVALDGAAAGLDGGDFRHVPLARRADHPHSPSAARPPRPCREADLMGWTLGRYFFFRYVTITFWFFLGILALVYIIDFTELSGSLGGLPGFTARTALGMSALRVPMIMQQVVPFVGLFAAMATLVSLNRKYELVIARVAGVSAWQFLLPACVGALLFGVLTITLLNPLAAYGFSRAEAMETALRAGHSNEVTAFDAPWI